MPQNTADACMFCGEKHTGNCGGTAAKKAAPKVARVQPKKKAAPPETKPGTPTPVAPSVVEQPSFTASRRPNLSSLARVRDPEAEELSRAVTVLAAADMLAHDELAKHRDIIKLPSWQIDAMIWKQVNRATSKRINETDQRSARKQ